MLERGKRIRTGFTLLEVLVAISLIAILGAIVVPSIAESNSAAGVTKTADDLRAIKAAVVTYRADAAGNAGRISFLSIQPTITDTSSCNGLQPVGGTLVVLVAGAVSNGWKGPYLSRANSRQGGFVTGIGILRDIVRRTAANNAVGDLVFMIPNVRIQDAIDLNDLMDGDGGSGFTKQSNAAGQIRYPLPNVNLMVDSVTYQFTITKEC